jgi:glycosyltransferase involved in cell wall biosynthesis
MKVFLISNESISNSRYNYFCNNKDLKTTPEGLSQKFRTVLIARASRKKKSYKINLREIKIFKNIFSYLFGVYKTFFYKDAKYLIISLSPYTFMACILIRLFKKKPMVYLRSDGYEEYKHILGFHTIIIYHLMFIITTKISHLISCEKKILKKNNGEIILPSQLNLNWFKYQKKINKNEIKILYVGRLSKEKGIFDLIELLKKTKEKFSLNVVGTKKDCNLIGLQNNIKLYNEVTNEKKLIKFYDNCNIFVLPSYTEGYPMVINEALARLRPVIIFKEIKHVKKNRKGIFVAQRNSKNLFKLIKYILRNYDNIQKSMQKNKLPTNEEFLNNLSRIIIKKN